MCSEKAWRNIVVERGIWQTCSHHHDGGPSRPRLSCCRHGGAHFPFSHPFPECYQDGMLGLASALHDSWNLLLMSSCVAYLLVLCMHLHSHDTELLDGRVPQFCRCSAHIFSCNLVQASKMSNGKAYHQPCMPRSSPVNFFIEAICHLLEGAAACSSSSHVLFRRCTSKGIHPAAMQQSQEQSQLELSNDKSCFWLTMLICHVFVQHANEVLQTFNRR